MALLSIHQKKSRFSLQIPHKIWINHQLIGIMKQSPVTIEMPPGNYEITIQSMIPFFSSSLSVHVQEEAENHLSFHDREGWWDLLFAFDILLWIAKWILCRFFPEIISHFPAHWELIYEIVTNGYFVIWLIYEWRIHNSYFRLHFQSGKQ